MTWIVRPADIARHACLVPIQGLGPPESGSGPEWIVVAAECTFTWYRRADLCEREGIAFVLGHAFDTRAVHGARARSDRIDVFKLAPESVAGILGRVLDKLTA